MLKWSQIQAIADKLAGRACARVRPHDLDEPWRTLYQRVSPLDPSSLDWSSVEWTLWKASEGLDDRHALVETVLNALPLPDDLPPFPSLQELAAGLPPVTWLWPGWIPRGMLSLLGAPPGVGKSLVALDLARRIIHGEPFPDGAPPGSSLPDSGVPVPRRRTVVYVDAEAVPQIQNQRAEAWDLDRRHLYLMLPPDPYGLLDLGCEAHQDTLMQMVHALQPELVVVDSLSSISRKGENNVEDVRAVLGFLVALAREFEVGLLLIHHLRKQGKLFRREAITLDDFRGSGHITAMARSVLSLSVVQDGPQPDRNGPRHLEVIKTNLCAHPRPLGLVFEPAGPHAPTLRYTSPPRPYRPPTQVDACAGWLVDLLAEAGKPLKPQEVVALAEEAGFTKSVVYRARKSLARTIADTGTRFSPHNRWALAERKQ